MPVVTAENRKQIFKEHGGSEANTGSVEGQIALFTARINHLTEQLKENKKAHKKLEKEIATIDEKLKTPEEYQKLVADPAFFTNYDSLKKQLDAEMSNWEHQTEHLQRL